MKYFRVPDREDWIYFKTIDQSDDSYVNPAALLPNIQDWLETHCPNRWQFSWTNEYYYISFIHDDDYILFTLAWSGDV